MLLYIYTAEHPENKQGKNMYTSSMYSIRGNKRSMIYYIYHVLGSCANVYLYAHHKYIILYKFNYILCRFV